MAPVRGGLVRLAAVTLIAGSLLFFISAETPVVSRYFRTGDLLLRLRSIQQDPAAWDLAMALLGAGGSIAALGLFPLARWVQQVTDRRILGVLAYLAAALAIGGAASWVIISYVRITRPPIEVVSVDASPWLFAAYRVLTRTAVLVLGVVLLGSGRNAAGPAVSLVIDELDLGRDPRVTGQGRRHAHLIGGQCLGGRGRAGSEGADGERHPGRGQHERDGCDEKPSCRTGLRMAPGGAILVIIGTRFRLSLRR
jgi:hypothetical protein